MTHRLFTCTASTLLAIACTLAGCTASPDSAADRGQTAVLLVQLEESDEHATPSPLLQRSWVSPGLLPSDPAQQQSWRPSELHIRLRHLGNGHSQPGYDHTLRLDGSQVSVELDEPTDDHLTLRIDQPGGSFIFAGGEVGKQQGRTVFGGPLVIRFHPQFRDSAERLPGSVSVLTLTRAALLGLNRADLGRFARLRVHPTLEQVVQLAEQAIAASDIQQLEEVGYRLTVAQLLELRAGDVSISDAVAFRRSGFDFTVAELVRLREAELRPSYAVAMKNAGFGRDATPLLQLHTHDVQPAYAARLRELQPDITHAQVIQIMGAGVDPETLAAFQHAGYDPTPDQLILLHRRDVSAEDALILRQVGYDFSISELAILRWWEVPASFPVLLIQEGFEPLSAEQIVKLHQREVTPDMVRLLRQANPEARAALAEGSDGRSERADRGDRAGSGDADRQPDPQEADEEIEDLDGLIDELGATLTSP